MTEQSLAMYGNRDDIREMADRLQKMIPGGAKFTPAEALTVAQVAVSHGLDPFNGEVWGIKYEKPANSGNWVWAGVMVGIKGLRKAARRQGTFWVEFARVEPTTYGVAQNAIVYECRLRDTDRIQKYGAAIHSLTTSGMPYADAVAMLGSAPVYIGIGIATLDEHSKMGLHARARKRAEADALKQCYDVQFGGAMLENGSPIVEGEVSVLGFDDDHSLIDQPRPENTVLAELGFVVSSEPYPEDTITITPPVWVLENPEPIEPPASLMTLGMAIGETSSTGEKYGDIPTDKLSHMANSLVKVLKNNDLTPEEREEKQRKLDACRVILAERAKQAV